MKVKQTLVCKKKYEVSTVKITGNLYEKKLYELVFVPLANTIPE